VQRRYKSLSILAAIMALLVALVTLNSGHCTGVLIGMGGRCPTPAHPDSGLTSS
jgi:hypothetical protein